MPPPLEFSRNRRSFILQSVALSLSTAFPSRLHAQSAIAQNGLRQHQDAVIPNDTLLKFNADGSPRRFAGNTIVCHLYQQSAVHEAVTAVGDSLRSSSFARKLAILPSDSYHATILGGVNDLDRHRSEWPADIPLNAPIEKCNEVIEKRFRSFKTREEMPIRFRFDRDRTIASQLASGLQLAPADSSEQLKLRRLRDRLADEVFHYRAANHSSFGFHISLAYQLRPFSPEEKSEYLDIMERHISILMAATPVIELGLPEFCTFVNMERFDVLALLQT